MPSCCCRSAARRRPSRCGRSWRTSPAAADIPPERLDDVAEHYLHFGGVSPINGINRALIEQLSRADRADRPAGVLRQPQLGAVRRGHRCGHARQRDSPCGGVHHLGVGRLLRLHAVQSRTSRAAARRPVTGAPELVKLRQYFDHPLLVEMFADGDRRRGRDPARRAARRRAAGVHRALDSAAAAIPLRHRPLQPPGRVRVRGWSRPPRATPTTTRCGSRGPGRRRCRGWNPMSPTTLSALADGGTKAVIVCPIGFVADHIEVVWDLDNELRQQADEPGIAFARAATPNADPRFARLVVDLIDELRDGRAPVTGRLAPDRASAVRLFDRRRSSAPPDCGARR